MKSEMKIATRMHTWIIDPPDSVQSLTTATASDYRDLMSSPLGYRARHTTVAE